MKLKASSTKVRQPRERLAHDSGGRQGIAVAPPSYGIDFVDRVVQPKLTVRPAGDRFEHQADRVAELVARQTSGPREPEAAARMTGTIPDSPTGVPVTPSLEGAIRQARSGGAPLDESVRRPMEHAFGADFSSVKIHTDSRAHELNSSLHARALTAGRDIYFGRGEYDPGNRKGRRLLAHELTHVIQQSGAAAAIQRVKIKGEKKPGGLLASKNHPDRFGEAADILNGPLLDTDFPDEEAAKVAVNAVLANCDVYSKSGPLRIQGLGRRCNEHLTHAAVVAYFRQYRNEIKEGDEQYLAVGEGRTKSKLYGQILYSNADGVIKYWHAHDKGKMG